MMTSENNTTATNDTTLFDYDTNGAMIYITIVLLWYSFGIVFILKMQMSNHSDEIEESVRQRARFLIQNLRDHYKTKEILEELANKQNRERLWDIYHGENTKDHFTPAENIRIRRIEKQLAVITRNDRLTNDTFFPSINTLPYFRSRSDHRPDASRLPFATTTTLRRRSSLDQQTLDRWKQLSNQSKTYEQLPWGLRKLMIRKYFPQHLKRSIIRTSERIKRTRPITDHEQLDLVSLTNRLPKLTRGRTETDLSTIRSVINERHNPYLSYFHIPSNQPRLSTFECPFE